MCACGLILREQPQGSVPSSGENNYRVFVRGVVF